MPIYQLQGTGIAALATAPAEVNGSSMILTRPDQLAALELPMAHLVAIWNGLEGVTPITRFKDRKIAVRRLWAAFEKLPVLGPIRAIAPDEAGPASTEPVEPPSKQAMVIAMMKHPGGVTLEELVAATGWQRHTVRGAISGTLRKKLGLPVRSARREDGLRAYSLA